MSNAKSKTKHRRTVAEIREEYARFVELYQNGLTPYEITKKLGITMLQYIKYFAQAISSEEITFVDHKYGTCFGKHLPKAILPMLKADTEDLIRFEPTDDNRVILIKVDN